MRIKIPKIKRKMSRRATALSLAMLMGFAAISPHVVEAFDLTLNMGHVAVVPSWQPEKAALAQTNFKKIGNYQQSATGMGFNENFYNSTAQVGTWPLGAAMYLEPIDGYDNSEYKDFEYRHTFCTANHVAASAITPGQRAFCSGVYTVRDLFKEAERGDNHVFNFLMLAIAASYPSDYTINKNATNITEDSGAASDLVSQTIAWCATDGDATAGFNGDWAHDFNLFKTKKGNGIVYYNTMFSGFPADPSVVAELSAAPTGGAADPTQNPHASEITNMADAWFWDIWTAATLQSQLTPDWDKNISTAGTAYEQKDGQWHAYMNLFSTPEAMVYLNGIQFEPYGDWEYVGQDEQNRCHFVSASGETNPDDGSIGTLTWAEGTIGSMLARDIINAKIATFDTWNYDWQKGEELGFGRTQTQFAAVMDKDLTLYVKLGGGDDTVPPTPVSPGQPHYEVHVDRYEHEENWNATYNVNLYKFDSETGKPIEGSHWDILEKFDESQLENTDLDRTPDDPGTFEAESGSMASTEWNTDDVGSNYEGNTGLLDVDANKYNWKNDKGTQFETWDDPHEDPCRRDDNVTGADGKLYEIDSSENITEDVAHTDIKNYGYHKGYCGGHPAPTFTYEELTGDPDTDAQIEADNQKCHDDGWAEWYAEVQKCEQLAKEGGFFHAIDEGVAQEALEADRDEFYKEFISLTYEHSAEEIEAASGYIIHGTHTDDIPIEWRVVTSSEYKDTEEANTLQHGGSSSGDTDTDDGDDSDIDEGDDGDDGDNEDDIEEENLFVTSSAKAVDMPSVVSVDAEVIADTVSEEVNTATASEANAVTGNTLRRTARKATSSDIEDEDIEDEDGDIIDGDILDDDDIATASEIERPEPERVSTGFIRKVIDKIANFFTNAIAMISGDEDADDGDSDSGSSGSYLRNTMTFLATKANTITAALSDIVDWTFIVYDHRTEGEIHFNKKDFDLQNDESDNYDSYADENADGTLEGAVYGLFAAEPIVHPDAETGTVYEEGDLVAIATTDRNGDASFMTFTEAPGTRYDYETGTTVTTEWNANAPKNLHTSEDTSAAFSQDIESFVGHNPDNSEITPGNGGDLPDTSTGDATYHWKNSSNQEYDSGMLANNKVTNASADTYREDETSRHYPISNNEDNNGNCWIGRPLIVGKESTNYYIKELSRSEGYELSVSGKNDELITNKEAFEDDSDVVSSKGTVTPKQISKDTASADNSSTFEITSTDTDNGYIVHLTNIPEGATISYTSSQMVWDDSVSHYEYETTYEPIAATKDAPVLLGGKSWSAKIGNTITYNGKTFTVNNVKTVEYDKQVVKPSNETRIENPYLDTSKITVTGNVQTDINSMFTKNQFRIPTEGAPWTTIEVASLDTETVAKAINDTLFADDTYGVFNAFRMVGSYTNGGKNYVVITYSCREDTTSDAAYDEKTEKIYVKTSANYTGVENGYIYRVYDLSDCTDVEKNENGFVTKATVPNEVASGTAQYKQGNPYDSITFKTRANESYWTYAEGEYLLNSDGSIAKREVKKLVSKTPTYVNKTTNTAVTIDSFIPTEVSAYGYNIGTYTFTVSQDDIAKAENGTIKFRITFDGDDETSQYKQIETTGNGRVGYELPLYANGSYIESVLLMYRGEDSVYESANTDTTPVAVTERPIRQQVKVSKDTETLPETLKVWYCANDGVMNSDDVDTCEGCGRKRTVEETKEIHYAHDTYTAFFNEDLSEKKQETNWITRRFTTRSLLWHLVR